MIKFRNQRKKLLHQQKERFKNKYKDRGAAILEKNKSDDHIDQIGNDNSTQNKEDSLRLDPLISPCKAAFNKSKVAEERNLENILKISELEQIDNSNRFIAPNMENRQEQKRISMGTVKQNKRKKLKLKEKVDSRVSTW